MTKRSTRKASWLLTVASAYSVVPACSDEPSHNKPDAKVESADGAVGSAPPSKADAATARDSGGAADEQDAGDPLDEIDIPTLIGVILYPPGGGDLPDLDAGAADTPPADDASSDAKVDLAVGLVAVPPDASVVD